MTLNFRIIEKNRSCKKYKRTADRYRTNPYIKILHTRHVETAHDTHMS